MFSKIMMSLISFVFLASCAAPIENPAPTAAFTATLQPTQTPTLTLTETLAPPEPTATPEPEKYTSDELSQMTDEERQEVFNNAPEIDDLEKSNFSKNKNNLIIYRDNTGKAQMVFDLSTGNELTLQEAGIVEFDKIDGGVAEYLNFETYENLYSYMSENALWIQGGDYERYIATSTFFENISEEDRELFDEWTQTKIWEGRQASGYTLPLSGGSSKEFFAGFKYQVEGGVFWCFRNENGNLELIFQES